MMLEAESNVDRGEFAVVGVEQNVLSDADILFSAILRRTLN